MARYEHLPIFREAYDLSVHIEKIVRNFSRYHKYTLSTDLRNKSRGVLEKIVDANNARQWNEGRMRSAECGKETRKEGPNEVRRAILLELRRELEGFKVLARLCHDSGGFSSTRSYIHLAELITNIARQNEGWIKKSRGQ